MIAYFNNTFDKNHSPADPHLVAEFIKSDNLKEFICYLRLLNKKEYTAEKQSKLPAVTWSGTFKPMTRSIETMESYSGLVCMDFDDLEPENIAVIKAQLINDPSLMYCFTSPSGKGVKAIMAVNTGIEDHRAAWLHLEDYFKKIYFLTADKSGKDASRLCYLSWDPQIIIKSAIPFIVDLKYGEITTQHSTNLSTMQATNDAKAAWRVCKKWVEDRNGRQYVEGERNVYIHSMSCALNRCGIDIDTAIALLDSELLTPDRKWLQSVRSAYFHNQQEHGTIQIRDIGATEFIAPAYVLEDNTNDPAAQDLKNLAAALMHFKVPQNVMMDIVLKIARYYQKCGYIDLNVYDPYILISQAHQELQVNVANNSAQFSLKYGDAADIGTKILSMDMSGVMPMYLKWFDEALGGGLLPGNYYGIIGFGGTDKSVLIQWMQVMDAMNGIPTLYLNGEMSEYQYFERLALMVLGINFRYMVSKGELREDNIGEYVGKIREALKNNAHVYSGSGFTKAQILATVDNIHATTGKKIKRVYMDGHAQMDWGGREEIMAQINNSFIGKEIAKEANNGEGVALLSLIHCSGEENKVMRNTGRLIRGGSKLLANMDGYLCTSLFIDPETITEENPDDFGFLSGVFHLRLVDKRSNAGEVSAVIRLNRQLHLTLDEQTDPRSLEVSRKKQQSSY
jgi:hypothetical protein